MARKNKKEEQEEEYKEEEYKEEEYKEEEYKEEEYEEIIEEDNRVCMFYVIERLDSIMEDCDTSSNNKALHDMKTQLRKFRDELVYNLGINSLNNQIAQNNITDYLK